MRPGQVHPAFTPVPLASSGRALCGGNPIWYNERVSHSHVLGHGPGRGYVLGTKPWAFSPLPPSPQVTRSGHRPRLRVEVHVSTPLALNCTTFARRYTRREHTSFSPPRAPGVTPPSDLPTPGATWGHLGPGPSQAEVPSPPRKGLSYNNPESPFTGSVVTGPPLLLIGHLLTPVLSPGTYLLPKSVVRKCPNVLPPRLLPPPAATLRACSASVLSLRQNAEFPTHMGISVGRAGEPWWNSASSGKCRTSGGQQRGAGAGGGEPSWELGSSSPEVTRSHP